MSEALHAVVEWEDPDENNGEWPYPTRYVKSLITGELADRSRKALGIAEDVDVFITERVESGGYSEYTQEDFREFTISAGDASETFAESWSGGFSTFQQLLRWLDAAEVSP